MAMAASKAFIAAVATIALIVQSAAATNFTVGAPGGSWDLQTNFAAWAASRKFVVGDNLIFAYSPQQHDVLEVSKANYDSCSTGGPIKSYATGNDVIPLPAAGTRYFICGFPGHCKGGMKVAVAVAGAAATAPPPASSPAPSSPGSSPPASSPPSSSSSPAPGSPGSPPGSSPAPTSPANSAPSPTTSAPPPPQTPGKSGAAGSSLQAKAAVGFGIGMLMIMAL